MKNTVRTQTKDLKKGMKVLHYGATFEILENAKNYGQRVELGVEVIKNNDRDVWVAPCKRIDSEDLGSLNGHLNQYDSFQSNSIYDGWKVIK